METGASVPLGPRAFPGRCRSRRVGRCAPPEGGHFPCSQLSPPYGRHRRRFSLTAPDEISIFRSLRYRVTGRNHVLLGSNAAEEPRNERKAASVPPPPATYLCSPFSLPLSGAAASVVRRPPPAPLPSRRAPGMRRERRAAARGLLSAAGCRESRALPLRRLRPFCYEKPTRNDCARPSLSK